MGWGIAANCDGGGSCHVLIRIEGESKVIHPKNYKQLREATHPSQFGQKKWSGFCQVSKDIK